MGFFAYGAFAGIVGINAAYHVITFIAAAFYRCISSVAGTIFPQIAGD